MANRQEQAQLMAEALANLVLYFPMEVNGLLANYGVDARNLNPSDRLSAVESLIQSNRTFAQEVVNMIGTVGGKSPNGEFTNFVDAIAAAVSGVTSGIASIVDATNPASQEAKKTNAQAALLNAQAQLEAARAKTQVETTKQKATIIVGVSLALAAVIGLGVFAYFKFKRNK